MLIKEYKAVAAEVAERMCARDPLGYESAKLQQLNPPKLFCRSRVEQGADKKTYELKIFVQLKNKGPWLAYIECDLTHDPVYGVNNMVFYNSSQDWDKTGFSFDVMRRFLEALDHHKFSYAATSYMEGGLSFFKKLGFRIIDVNLEIADELKSRAVDNDHALALRQLLQYPRSAHDTRAVLNFMHTPDRNNAFARMGLPLKECGRS